MEHKWWHDAVIYEIYCKSFCDSNGDGIGDLPGVISKLPILKDLGVTCIWFAPIYKSPMVDNGYDVEDYRDIDPAYGTLEDFKRLLDTAHSLGIRVIMDQVLNHSSDRCRWFQESRKSKDNPYRNFYIWQPPKADGSEPNNWGNVFREGNGSAWTFDEATGEYYLHQYSAKMPDLNWEYEPMRRELYDMLRFWLDMGVDGFRLDVFTHYKKPAGFPDTDKVPDPVLDRNGFVRDMEIFRCQEGIHQFLQEMHREVFGPYGCMTVGEGSGVTAQNARDFIREDRQEIATVYHFALGNRNVPPFTAEKYRFVQKQWADVMADNCWATQYLSNHDSARQVSHYGDDSAEMRAPSAKLLATLIHTTPGTPFIYQGEEIGMVNVRFDRPEDYNDPSSMGEYRALVLSGMDPAEALARVAPRSRDNARTPYQWNDGENAGFTTGKPWLKVNPAYTRINLEADRKSPDSIFAYYQKLTALRREYPAIPRGDLQFLLEDHPHMLMYLRRWEDQTLLIVANYSGKTYPVTLPDEIAGRKFRRILTNREETVPSLERRDSWLPWEAEVYLAEP